MKDYYYIKIKSIEYDQPDGFLTKDGVFLPFPEGIRIFNDLDEAIDVKKILPGEHEGYTVEIVRF